MRKTNLALMAIIALALVTASAQAQLFRPRIMSEQEVSERARAIEQAEAKANFPRPDFAAVTSPTLERALKTPDSFWEFVTSPEPPYMERMAAVRRMQTRDFNAQAQQIYPVERLPQLMAAIGELNRARRQFEPGKEWGLKPHPLSSRSQFLDESTKSPVAGTEFILVGHAWSVPAQSSDYPITFEEESRAPWPWQLNQLLNELLRAIQPYASAVAPEAGLPFEPSMVVLEPTEAEINGWRASIERARAYHRAALQMPVKSDEEAVLFVEATAETNHRPLEVIARWRRLALDARFAESATRIARTVGSGQGVWADARSRAVAQAITIDILSRSPHLKARQEAAMSLRELRQEQERRREKIALPVPYATVLVASQQALDARNGDEWTRLYCYVRGVCQIVDNPPFDSQSINVTPESAEIHRRLEVFERWFAQNKEQFQIQARADAQEIEAARAAMERLEPTS